MSSVPDLPVVADKAPRYVPGWAYELFLRIAEPRVVRIMQFFVYVVAIIGGLSTWFSPPESIANSLGYVLTIIWGASLLIGGTLGVSSVLRGTWWLERAGVIFCSTGIAMYGVVATFLQVENNGQSRFMQIATIAIALISFAVRWVRIRRYAYDPEG